MNDTVNVTEASLSHRFIEPNIGLAIAFSLVLLVALFGNIATLFVFKYNDWLKSHQCHTYIFGLALADIGTALVPLPANTLIALGLWQLSQPACMAYDYFRLVVENNGVLITLLISFDRFRLLKWDFKNYIKGSTCQRISAEIAVTWLLPAIGHGIMAIVWIVSVPLKDREAEYSTDCQDTPSEADIPFSTLYATLLIFTPGILLAIFSILTFIGVARLLKNRRRIAGGTAFLGPPPVPSPNPGNSKRSNNATTNRSSNLTLQINNAGTSNQSRAMPLFCDNNDQPSPNGDERGHISTQGVQRRSGRHGANPTNAGPKPRQDLNMTRYIRPAIMLAGIVCVFVICWFPFAIYYVYVHIISPASYSMETQMWLRCLLYANSAINPFIYALTDRKLRQGYGRICRSLRRRFVGNI